MLYRATYENGEWILVNADSPAQASAHAEHPAVNLTPACRRERTRVQIATNVPAVRNGRVVSVDLVEKATERARVS